VSQVRSCVVNGRFRRRLWWSRGAGVGIAIVGTAVAAEAAAPDRDPSWGAGTAIELSYPIQVESWAQVVRPDGSVYVIGEPVSDLLAGPVVTKVGPAGVDASFGVAGTIRLAPSNPQFSDVATGQLDATLQPASERLIVVGRRGGQAGWAIAGMTSSGALDATFGTAGTAYVGAVSGYLAAGADPHVVANGDGSLVVIGYVERNQYWVPGAVKLTASGRLDVSFGVGGLAVAPLSSQPQSTVGTMGGVALDSAGRIVAVGTTPSNQSVLVRWTGAGVLDTSLASDGVIVGDHSKCGVDVAVDALSRMIVACDAGPTTAANPQVALVRYGPNGTLDRSFGADGVAAVPPHTRLGYSRASSVVTQGSRIVVAGTIGDGFIGAFDHRSDVGMWRFTESGQLDRSFGSAGGVIRDDFATIDTVKDVVALPGGRLHVLATSSAGPSAPQTALYRYLPATVAAEPSIDALSRPERLLDTRVGVGAPVGKVTPQGDLRLTVIGIGDAQVPADAIAVAMNVTATDVASPGFVTVYPCGSDRPVASNLNFAPGDTIPNLVVARVGTGGAVCIHASSPAHVVADLVAFYGARSDLRPLDVPTRAIDTRSGLGTAAPGRIGGTVVAQLPVSAVGDFPHMAEYVLNVTVTEPEGPGFVTVHQCDTVRPVASNLNYGPGQTIANLVIARAAGTGAYPTGTVCFYSSAPTHLIVDVIATLDIGAAHRPLAAPARLLDTREGVGAPLGLHRAGDVLELDVTGLAGVPDDAAAVTLNVTVTQAQADGFVTVYPCGQAPPLASNLNFERGETIPNLVITKVGARGAVCITGIADTHLVADLAEWIPAVS
jgi:uncharacterized delta-60 repeat protein